MKVRRSPKIFNNLPLHFKLDLGDRVTLDKYRDELETKQRQNNRKQNIDDNSQIY